MARQVLLINPPFMFSRTGEYLPNKEVWKPLGILYLAAALEKEGISVGVIDMVPRNGSLSAMLDLIARESPQLVGITGTTPQIRGITQLGKAVKERFGDKLTLAGGGSHVSCDPAFLEVFPWFDFALVGEGEITFPLIVKRVLNGESIRGIISGVSPQDLDKLSFPAHHLLNNKYYAAGMHGAFYATVHTTRGCPFRCIYCSSPVERLSAVRYRSPENVMAEVEDCIQKLGTKYFIFTDDTFTLDADRTKRICQLMLEKNLKIQWCCETRANLVDRELLSEMKRAGCVELFFGVETGSERIRNKVINKRVSEADIYQVFKLCRDLEVKSNAFLMVGFPTETKKDLQKTADFAFRANPDLIGVHLTSILPGAPIFKQAIREGKVTSDVWHKYAKGEIKNQPVYIPDELTLAEMESFQKNLYFKFYFRLGWMLARLKVSFTSWNKLTSDLDIAWRLLTKGRSKVRSYKEEDYFK